MKNRVETGPIKFVTDDEEDWPGLFIRGDEAYRLAGCIEAHLGSIPSYNREKLRDFVRLLRSPDQRLGREAVKVRRV